MNFSIVIPVKNERESVLPLEKKIRHTLSSHPWKYEILFVDDGSTDDTVERLRLSGARWIAHARTYGQSQAIHTGVIHAKYPHVLILDGDGQICPSQIPTLIQRYLEAPRTVGMITGERQRRQDPISRRWSSSVANRVRHSLLRDQSQDSACGFKILSRELFLRLPYFDHMHRFMPVLVRREGLEVLSISIIHQPRLSGTSKYGFWDRVSVGVWDLAGVFWLLKRKSPVIMHGQ